MIVGISGYIGSGKDTVGSIIQCLTHSKAIGYTGTIKESDFNDYIKGHNYNQANWKIQKFAYKLKQCVSLLTGIPVEDMEKQEVKDRELGEEWWFESGMNGMFPEPILNKPTVRWLLQRLGTEAVRNHIHQNAWVNALFADYKGTEVFGRGYPDNFNTDYPNWIITDMRFPNEFDAIKQKDGITIRIVRYPKEVVTARGYKYPIRIEPFDPENPKHMALWKGECAKMHASETALDNHTFDYQILNNGSIDDLILQVKHVLATSKII